MDPTARVQPEPQTYGSPRPDITTINANNLIININQNGNNNTNNLNNNQIPDGSFQAKIAEALD